MLLINLVYDCSKGNLDIDTNNINFLEQLTDITIDHLKILQRLEEIKKQHNDSKMGITARYFLELDSYPMGTIKLQSSQVSNSQYDLVLPDTNIKSGTISNSKVSEFGDIRPEGENLQWAFLNTNQLSLDRNKRNNENKIRVRHSLSDLSEMIAKFNLDQRREIGYINDMILVEFPDFEAINYLNSHGWSVAYFPNSLRTDSRKYPTTGTAFISRYKFPTNPEFFILPTPFGYRTLSKFNGDTHTINTNLTVYYKPFPDQSMVVGGYHESAANSINLDSFGSLGDYSEGKINFRLVNAVLHALLNFNSQDQLVLGNKTKDSDSQIITFQDSNYYGFDSNSGGDINKVLYHGLPGLPLLWSMCVSILSRLKKQPNLNQNELTKVEKTLEELGLNQKLYNSLKKQERLTFLVGSGLLNKILAYLLNMSLDNVIATKASNIKVEFVNPINTKGKLVTDHKMIVLDADLNNR